MLSVLGNHLQLLRYREIEWGREGGGESEGRGGRGVKEGGRGVKDGGRERGEGGDRERQRQRETENEIAGERGREC